VHLVGFHYTDITIMLVRFFPKNTQTSNFLKSVLWEPDFFNTDGRKYRWADGRTDTTKLTVAFRNFANAPKKFLITSMKTFPFFCTLFTNIKE